MSAPTGQGGRAGAELPLHIADLLYAASAEGPLLRDESYDLAVQILAAAAPQVPALQADVARLEGERDAALEQRDRAVRAWVAWIPAA